MDSLAKTFILNNENEKSFKAILNLSDKTESYIKFFNLKEDNKKLAIGIMQNGKVITVPLQIVNNSSTFNIKNKLSSLNSCSCAVVNVSNPFCPRIVLSNAVNTTLQNEKIENAFIQTKPKDTSILYEEDSDEKVDDIIDKNLKDDISSTYYDHCAGCKYREAFYCEGKICENKEKFHEVEKLTISESNLERNEKDERSNNQIQSKENYLSGDNTEEKESNITDENEGSTFYSLIKSQVDELFRRHPSDDILQNIIPQSKWVKVKYDKSDNFYVLGLICNEEKEKYICYGIPSNDNKNPPKEFENYAEWVPVNTFEDGETGYWIMCQDAITGETLKTSIL